MQQVGQWQTQQSWQAQAQHPVHQIAHNPKNFEAPAVQSSRRHQSQAIPIVDAPTSSPEKPLHEKKSAALMIVDPDTMEEVKVEKMTPKPRTTGKGGKGKGPRLTGLANYEARKMTRQSSIGKTQVSSAFSGVDLNDRQILSEDDNPSHHKNAPSEQHSEPQHQHQHQHLEQHQEEFRTNLSLSEHLAQPAQFYQPGYNLSLDNQYYTDEQQSEWRQEEHDAAPDDIAAELDEDDTKNKSKAQLKNQKKHQRQRDRKAKELRTQCLQVVVKWKLCALAQPLFGMGFPEEQCIDAVCACTDGKTAVDLERCVAWIVNEQQKGSAFAFGCKDDARQQQRQRQDIDISDEVRRMGELEAAMGITGPEVERAVLAHNGDVTSAAATLVESGLTAMAH